MNKICGECGLDLPIEEFYKSSFNGKPKKKCKKCEYSREKELKDPEKKKSQRRFSYANNREKQRERIYFLRNQDPVAFKEQQIKHYTKMRNLGLDRATRIRKDQPGKLQSRETVKYAVKKGILTRPEKCAKCSSVKHIVAHHESYLKKDHLTVQWWCNKCHLDYHSRYDALVVIVDVSEIISDPLVKEEDINSFAKAVKEFPQQNFFSCINEKERLIFEKVFLFMKTLNQKIIKAEYGLLVGNIYGISAIVDKRPP